MECRTPAESWPWKPGQTTCEALKEGPVDADPGDALGGAMREHREPSRLPIFKVSQFLGDRETVEGGFGI